MAPTPRAVICGLVLFFLVSPLSLLALRKNDIPSSQNGFFSGCAQGDTCPTLTLAGTATLSGKDANGNAVTVTINLYDWSCVNCTPGANHAVLDVILTGSDGVGVQSLAVKGVLPNPRYVTCGDAGVGIGCVSGPAPDQSQDVQEPMPIAGADSANTWWDFGWFQPGPPPPPPPPLNLFDQITCSPSSGNKDLICQHASTTLGEAVLVVDGTVAGNNLGTSQNNYLAILTDGTQLGGLALPSPAGPATNNTQATAVVITTADYQDYIDTSLTNPQENPDGSEAYPSDFTPIPLTNPPTCNPTNGQTGNPTGPDGGPSNPNAPDDRTFRTVWYTYTAPSNGSITISTSGSRYDTLIYVFTGSVNQPVDVACNDDNNGLLQAVTTFNAVSAMVYQIVVEHTPSYITGSIGSTIGYPLSVDGTLYFNFQFTPAPPTYPVPFIDNIQPAAAVPGATVPQVTISGAGFVKGAVVRFNGATLTPASISPNRIVLNNVTVPANPVTVPIAVINPNQSPNVSTSNVAPFPVTTAAPVSFGSSPTALQGGAVFAPVAVDLNGDGKLDVVFASEPYEGAVVLLGNGNGTFQPAAAYPAPEDNNSVAVGDFNGDGNLDLIVTNSSSGTIWLLPGKGDGTFQNSIPDVIGGSPYFAVTGDFNGDGKLDLALLEGTTGKVWILLGNGDGTFQPPAQYPAATDLQYAIPGDFNGDGILDLAVLNNGGGANSVSILLGNGNGTFQAPKPPTQTDVGPVYEVAGDFNGDGKLDLAVANETGGTVSVLLGNGDGTFKPRVDYSGGGNTVLSVVAGDVNGDGILDLLVATGGGLSLLLGNGNGTFQSPIPFSESNNPSPAVLGDFNGDGRLDVIAPDDFGYDVFLQQIPIASFSPTSLTFAAQSVSTLSPAKPLVFTNTGSAPLTVSSIMGSGDFKQTNNCSGTLKVGAFCTINVIFNPTSVGTILGSITVTDNASIPPQIVDLNGVGAVPLTLSPTGLAFGTIAVGKTSAAKTVTITNNAPKTQNITFVASGNYAAVGSGSLPCGSSLASGASCTISVTFTPTANGVINGAVTVTDHTVVPEQEVTLSGTGTGGAVAPLTFSPPTLSFLKQAFDTTSPPQPVTVTNGSTNSVTISTIVSSGNFNVTGVGGTPCAAGTVLAATKACTMNVTFTPTYLGTIKGAVVVSDNASVGQQVLNVSGVGILPVTFSHTTLTFSAQSVGTTSAPQSVTVTNNLTTTLSNIAMAASGDFLLANNTCSTTLAANSQCSFTVTFTPSQVGSITGGVTITDSAFTSPQAISLSGTGQ